MTATTKTTTAADPRPRVVDGPGGYAISGARCAACQHPSATMVPRCSCCGRETVEAMFGPEGTIWATTTIHVASGERSPPYTLIYLDLDDGPRVLAHVLDGPTVAPRIAERARLIERTDRGDPQVEVIR
jgi:uncharacterized OB-fold protein